MAKMTRWTQVLDGKLNRQLSPYGFENSFLVSIRTRFISFSFLSFALSGLGILGSLLLGSPHVQAADIKVPRSDIESFLTSTGRMQTIRDWKVLFSFWEIRDRGLVRVDYGSLYEDTNLNSKIDGGDQGFFNPASTVKTAIAALVLEDLKRYDFQLSDSYRAVGQEWKTFESDLELMQVLSDNEATNRLIMYLGFDAIDSRMKELRFNHFSLERLMLGKGTLIESPPHEAKSRDQIVYRPARKVSVKSRCEEALGKIGNCASQEVLLNVFLKLNDLSQDKSFDIRTSDRNWLFGVMSKTPKELGYDYPDDWNRFLQSKQDLLVGPRGRLISKGGVALWSKTWTDTSLILADDGRRMLVAITVMPPEDVTQKMAFPFMADLAFDLKTWVLNY
jgi:hypothetical protein